MSSFKEYDLDTVLSLTYIEVIRTDRYGTLCRTTSIIKINNKLVVIHKASCLDNSFDNKFSHCGKAATCVFSWAQSILKLK